MRTTSSILCVIASFIAAGKNQISITELVILSGISRQSVKQFRRWNRQGKSPLPEQPPTAGMEANAYYLPDQLLER
ncbi:MarR family transcriptional regulator [Escherichia coli]